MGGRFQQTTRKMVEESEARYMAVRTHAPQVHSTCSVGGLIDYFVTHESEHNILQDIKVINQRHGGFATFTSGSNHKGRCVSNTYPSASSCSQMATMWSCAWTGIVGRGAKNSQRRYQVECLTNGMHIEVLKVKSHEKTLARCHKSCKMAIIAWIIMLA